MRRQFPAWFYRVHNLAFSEGDRDVCPHDFDEDLSSLEESSDNDEEESSENDEEDRNCECDGEDSECECQMEDEEDTYDSDDSMSERSYDGSDADYYYELKDQREERKRQLRDERKYQREVKEDLRRFENSKEKEVLAACESFEKAEMEGETPPLDSIAGKTFRLYSVNHVDLCYSDLNSMKYVEFHPLDEDDLPHRQQQPDGVHGHVYFNANATCHFGPFRPPEQASLESCRVESVDGEYELRFQFISDDYLKLQVSRELVFIGMSQSPTAPEVFEFAGIRYDWKNGIGERWRAKKRKRSPSPRETWFEMNHPMGSWRMGGY